MRKRGPLKVSLKTGSEGARDGLASKLLGGLTSSIFLPHGRSLLNEVKRQRESMAAWLALCEEGLHEGSFTT